MCCQKLHVRKSESVRGREMCGDAEVHVNDTVGMCCVKCGDADEYFSIYCTMLFFFNIVDFFSV